MPPIQPQTAGHSKPNKVTFWWTIAYVLILALLCALAAAVDLIFG